MKKAQIVKLLRKPKSPKFQLRLKHDTHPTGFTPMAAKKIVNLIGRWVRQTCATQCTVLLKILMFNFFEASACSLWSTVLTETWQRNLQYQRAARRLLSIHSYSSIPSGATVDRHCRDTREVETALLRWPNPTVSNYQISTVMTTLIGPVIANCQ